MKYKTNDKYYPYEITSTGEIRNGITKKKLSPCLGNHGYMAVTLKVINKNVLVHRMLCEIWLPNPENKEQVNHKNGTKTHNTLDNLEWVTRSENMQHAADLQLLSFNGKCGEECNLAKHSEIKIRNVCEDLQNGMRNIDVMEKHGVSKDVVKSLKAGDSWKHVTKDYVFPSRRNTLSEATVRWVCNKIVEGLGNTAILKLSTNKNLKLFHIKNIKHKTSYKHISKDYF